MRFLILLILVAVTSTSDSLALEVDVYGNRSLTDEAILRISGISQDPSLSALEVKRKLETSDLFSDVAVRRGDDWMTIIVAEKATWFVLPYLSVEEGSLTYGLAGGKSTLMGDYANLLGRFQTGNNHREASLRIRDEYFMNTLFVAGASLDYEDSLHHVYVGRDLVQETYNYLAGGSIQVGYHIWPDWTLGLNTYIEKHRFEELDRRYFSGTQLSHRLLSDFGNYTLKEGLARGATLRTYFETTNPASSFQFYKCGASAKVSALLIEDFNWIIQPAFEMGRPLPRYQLFELGGSKLRSFPAQQFRDNTYGAIQNDFLLTSESFWKLKVRPLVYFDWAYIQSEGHAGVGFGANLYFEAITIPAVQFFAGYGFNPGGFSMSASIGPQF